MHKKGISPILAAVLLIAFTVALAGIMATWATNFARQKLADTGDEADCVGALDISELSFNGEIIGAKVRNVGIRINMTGIKAYVQYNNVSLNREYQGSAYGITDPLPPAATSFLVIDTNSSIKPEKLEILSVNCPREGVTLEFR